MRNLLLVVPPSVQVLLQARGPRVVLRVGLPGRLGVGAGRAPVQGDAEDNCIQLLVYLFGQ